MHRVALVGSSELGLLSSKTGTWARGVVVADRGVY